MRVLPSLLPVTQASRERRRAAMYKSLIHQEARLGGELFGDIPEGNRREFFCLDEHTWVWHEEWMENGQRLALTTRYDIRPTGILKSQGGRHYQALTVEETRNLYNAMRMYVEKMRAELPKLAYAS
ncbi:MAG: hypothetical protein JWM37_547 [Candidatus Saccharibacteria bacterium]|nr:hypothetical protein [Candidatus Saccharibacteria bacterium]